MTQTPEEKPQSGETAPGSFECYGQTFNAPLEPVEDLDGELMPFNPAMKPEFFEPDPSQHAFGPLGPWVWWCGCGHLVVDHHAKSDFSAQNPVMYCWAKGCPCKMRIG